MANAYYFKVKNIKGDRITYTYTVVVAGEVLVEGLSRAQAQATVDELNAAAEAAEANVQAIRDAMDPGPWEGVSDEELDAMVNAWEVSRGW